MQNKRRVNVRAIIVRGNKILALRHKDEDGVENEYWGTPGGGLDPFESLQEGVKREVMEELGIDAKVGKLLFMQQFPSGRSGFDEELEFFFLVEDSPEYDTIDLSKTSHGALELAGYAFVDPKEVYIKPDFLSEIDIADYVQNERTPYLFNDLHTL